LSGDVVDLWKCDTKIFAQLARQPDYEGLTCSIYTLAVICSIPLDTTKQSKRTIKT